jgi:poly(hydroxyalkanoate) depolymerase family esterase
MRNPGSPGLFVFATPRKALMNLKIPPAILQATRFVRSGRVLDATNVIQRALRGGASAPTVKHDPIVDHPKTADVSTIEGSFRIIDREARSPTGQFIERTYSSATGNRNYKVYVPAVYNEQALPVVVMLHGCKQDPDDFAAGTRMNALAEEHGFVAVYPEQSSSANASNCWNWFQAKHQQRDRGEPVLIAGITREVATEFGCNLQRVYIAGLSAGGAMAAVMATTYPDVYAAVGIHSGLAHGAALDLPSAFAAMRGERSPKRPRKGREDTSTRRRVPVIVFHGDNDRTVHPRNGDDLIAHASGATADARPPTDAAAALERTVQRERARGREYTRTTYRDATGKSVIEQWIVHGAGHAWYGGSAEGSFTDPTGPDASREMLRFFFQHESRST